MNKCRVNCIKFRARCSFLIQYLVRIREVCVVLKVLMGSIRWIENEKLIGQGGGGETEREWLVVSQVESLGTSSIIRQVMIADKPYTPLDEL